MKNLVLRSLPLLPLLIVGCGGGSSSSGASRGKGGSAVVTLQWPARSRLVPLSSSSAVVELSALRSEAQTRLVVRSGDAASPGKATFTGLVPGSYTVTVKAFPGADGTGVVQAAGSSPLEVTNEGARLDAKLDSTVTHLSVSAPSASVKVGETLALTASAKDKDGALVLLAADGIQEKLDWTVTPAGAAAIQGTGPSVALTGVSPADVTVNARLKIKDDGTTVTAALPVKIVRNVVAAGLATAGWPVEGGSYGATFAGRGPAASGALGTPIVVGGYRSSPAVVVGPDGTLYIGSDTKVVAQGAANWEVANAAGDYCRSLALTQGGVLLGGTDKGVFARDAATGALLWTFASSRASALVVGRDGTVYANADKLYALDGATGAVRWAVPKAKVQAVGDDGTLYGVATEATGIKNDVTTRFYARAWNPSNGAVRWSQTLGTSSRSGGFGASAVSFAGNLVYLKTYRTVPINSSQRASYGNALALRTSDGGRAWNYDLGPALETVSAGSGIAVRGGMAFAQWRGRAVALDALTGAVRWDVPGDDDVDAAIAADGTVYCLARGIYLSFALRALDSATGLTRWQTEPVFGAGDMSPLALADDGTVYVAASFLTGSNAQVYPVR